MDKTTLLVFNNVTNEWFEKEFDKLHALELLKNYSKNFKTLDGSEYAEVTNIGGKVTKNSKQSAPTNNETVS